MAKKWLKGVFSLWHKNSSQSTIKDVFVCERRLPLRNASVSSLTRLMSVRHAQHKKIYQSIMSDENHISIDHQQTITSFHTLISVEDSFQSKNLYVFLVCLNRRGSPQFLSTFQDLLVDRYYSKPQK